MNLIVVLKFIAIGIGLFVIIYLASRMQMLGWLHELDKQLGKKFTDYINSKKKKEDGNTKEEI